eukprot:4825275-Prymnesium_polylepis.1
MHETDTLKQAQRWVDTFLEPLLDVLLWPFLFVRGSVIHDKLFEDVKGKLTTASRMEDNRLMLFVNRSFTRQCKKSLLALGQAFVVHLHRARTVHHRRHHIPTSGLVKVPPWYNVADAWGVEQQWRVRAHKHRHSRST